MTLEYCIECDEATGNAGISEDSLYDAALKGPYCKACFDSPARFKKGTLVRYVPNHANGDYHHKDCQDGVVSSTNAIHVFVKYNNLMCTMTTGDEPYTAQATLPLNLALR